MLSEFAQKYQIRDLELISGIKAHTIRIWEQRYNILNPERSLTNIRYYSDNDLKKLLNIVLLLKKGFKISDFKKTGDDEIADLVRKSTLRIPGTEAFVVAMLNFDIVYFNRFIDDAITSMGFEKTLDRIIYPLMEKIGLLWLTNAITPAHEHFVSNILRQKFFRQIDLMEHVAESKKTFLLFLPYYEQHEMSLLYAYYVIKKYGHKAIYLGQNVPTEDVLKVSEVIEPDFLVCFFISKSNNEEVNSLLHVFSASIPACTVIAGGGQIDPDFKFESTNIKFVQNINDLKRFL
jgi:DNA-binding transcriptional MerR regulator